MQTLNTDVAVIGAGLAGLTAARNLIRLGHEVIVLEAASRVGGRTLSETSTSGDIVDGGGQWVGRTHTRVLSLAKELGVDTFPSPTAGMNLLHFEGKSIWFGKGPPRVGLLRVLDLLQLTKRLDRLASTIPLESPWTAPNAAKYDALSFGDWLERNCFTTVSKFMLTTFCRLNIGTDPRNVSLLYVLFKVHSAGGFRQLTAMDGGLEMRFVQGSQSLSQRMAEALGHRVRMSAPVNRIEHSDRSVRVIGGDFEITAKRVIVAVDPVMAGKLDYDPCLPVSRRSLCRHWTLKKARKIHCIYARPFWREKGLSGRMVLDSGPVIAVYDNGRPQSSHGVLVVFSDFPDEEKDRKKSVLEILAAHLGEEALHPIDYVEKDWGEEPWMGGCVSNPVPRVLSSWGQALRVPEGAVFWASAETAAVWEGHMEGAVRAGEATAEAVARSLSLGLSTPS